MNFVGSIVQDSTFLSDVASFGEHSPITGSPRATHSTCCLSGKTYLGAGIIEEPRAHKSCKVGLGNNQQSNVETFLDNLGQAQKLCYEQSMQGPV